MSKVQRCFVRWTLCIVPLLQRRWNASNEVVALHAELVRDVPIVQRVLALLRLDFPGGDREHSGAGPTHG
jgi:hypothetical protein